RAGGCGTARGLLGCGVSVAEPRCGPDSPLAGRCEAMDARTYIRERLSAVEWEALRRCRFVRRTFRPYACLVLAAPPSPAGVSLWRPYRGEPYDPAVYDRVEGGWDHERCDVCDARIGDGDVYWTSDGPEHVDLCAA